MPHINVILPVFNGGDYLKLSVQSVLGQDFSDFDLLIIDDKSNDNSAEYLSSLNDPRVKVFYNKINKGLFWNINFLIKNSNSELIKLWSQDDIMYKNCLKSFAEFHSLYPEVGFSYSKVHYIDSRGHLSRPEWDDPTPEIISSELHAKISFEYGCIAGNISNTCITRKALDKVGLFNENMKISADFEMWVRVAEYFHVGFVKKHLIQLRDHDQQLSRNEKLYIYHVVEDLEVYKYLQSYVSPNVMKAGMYVFKRKKLIFYYILMLKTFFKGHIITGIKYYKLLKKFDNFFCLSIRFIRVKLLN